MWIGTSSWIAQLIILRILNIGVNCLSRFNTSRFDLKLSQSVGWFKFGFAFGHSSVKWADSHQIISESVNQLYCAMTKWNSDRERKKQTKGFLSNANRKFNFKSINKQLIEKGETTRRNRRRRRRRRRRGRRWWKWNDKRPFVCAASWWWLSSALFLFCHRHGPPEGSERGSAEGSQRDRFRDIWSYWQSSGH